MPDSVACSEFSVKWTNARSSQRASRGPGPLRPANGAAVSLVTAWADVVVGLLSCLWGASNRACYRHLHSIHAARHFQLLSSCLRISSCARTTPTSTGRREDCKGRTVGFVTSAVPCTGWFLATCPRTSMSKSSNRVLAKARC